MAISKSASQWAVLVTRPEGEAAQDLCAKVGELGLPVYHQPLLTLTALEALDAASKQCVLELDSYEHVIFVSANAVRFGMAHIEDYWPQLPVGLNWFAIGGATAALLSQYGVDARAPTDQMTSEGLLALPPLARVESERVLIVKGRGGRDALRQELVRRGAIVDELACYERGIPQLPEGELAGKLARWNIGVILLSSGEGLANLQVLLRSPETTNFSQQGPGETSPGGLNPQELMPRDPVPRDPVPREACLIVPSGRVAQQAREAGFSSVIVADNASDSAMLNALSIWNASSGE